VNMVIKLWVPQNAGNFFFLTVDRECSVTKTSSLKNVTLHYIIFLGSKVRMTVGYKNMCTVQLNFSHTKTQASMEVTHKAIQK
jgi:hypothetical protein